jgi:hypothetical protein
MPLISRMHAMGIDDFKLNVELAVELLSKQRCGDRFSPWLNEKVIAGIPKFEFDALPDDEGFLLGIAVARFRRIAREVAEANGIAEREQTKLAAAALRTISRILKSLVPTNREWIESIKDIARAA